MGLIDSDMDDLKYEIADEKGDGTRIKVIGVGGGGCNAVARMMDAGVEASSSYACQHGLAGALGVPVPNKLQLGVKMTNGSGRGLQSGESGARRRSKTTDSIVEDAEGADMVFVTAGLGGGTGTGAAPVVASSPRNWARSRSPWSPSHSPSRPAPHAAGRREVSLNLIGAVDTVIDIPNDRLLAVPRGTSFFESFKVADDVLRQAVQGISDIIITPGLINRDFSDIKATMAGMGYAMMGTAIGRGEKAAVDAARQAISCPLLEDSRIAGSRGILINITGSSRLGLHEVSEACSIIREAAECDDVQINFGVILDESLADAVKITVIATGFQPESAPRGGTPAGWRSR